MGASSRRSTKSAKKSSRAGGRIDREVREVVAAERAGRGVDESAMERVTRDRVLEPLAGERVVSRRPVQVTLLPVLGPEPWELVATTGKNYGGARAGRILVVLPGGGPVDPLAGLAYAVEYGRPYVHHVWVDAEARGRGLSRVLFDAYRAEVSPRLVVAGPFTAVGRAAAERAGAILEE